MVTKVESPDGSSFLPRDIDDTPLDDPDGDAAGYLTPTGEDDPDYSFTGEVASYPEEWREERNGIERLRPNRKRCAPQEVTVGPDGVRNPSGPRFWFIPGKFGFCPYCLNQPQAGMRERTNLPGLSGEGRSSATTLLVSTALEWMNRKGNGIPSEKRKLLGFTDNRQDAALQAGHFNDFVFVSLLRGEPWRFELSFGPEHRSERRQADPHSVSGAVDLDCGIQLRGSSDLIERQPSGLWKCVRLQALIQIERAPTLSVAPA